MARPKPTPAPLPEAEEPITPLQKLLTGTLLLSLVLVPIFSFGMYLAPFYKGEHALYRGAYFMIGVFAAIALSAVFSYLWMTYLPTFFEQRQERRAEKDAAKKARAQQADRAERRRRDEDE